MLKMDKRKYEILRNMQCYKKNLGHNFHLCTIYGVAGNKEEPLWKRILSHVYVIVIFKVIDNEGNNKFFNKVPQEEINKLNNSLEEL